MIFCVLMQLHILDANACEVYIVISEMNSSIIVSWFHIIHKKYYVASKISQDYNTGLYKLIKIVWLDVHYFAEILHVCNLTSNLVISLVLRLPDCKAHNNFIHYLKIYIHIFHNKMVVKFNCTTQEECNVTINSKYRNVCKKMSCMILNFSFFNYIDCKIKVQYYVMEEIRRVSKIYVLPNPKSLVKY